MKELSHEEIKQRQIEILKYLKEACEENNICYSLAFGTLLGAVRHGGYIPWDDDIDVLVPRKDYEKLCDILRAKKGRFFLLDDKSNKDYYNSFAKIIDTETNVDRPGAPAVDNLGLWIDIFPLDTCPSDEKTFYKHFRKFNLLNHLRFLRAYKGIPKGINPLRTAVLCALKLFASFSSKNFWRKKYNAYMQKFNGKDTGYVCCYITLMKYKEIFPVSQLENMGKISFEGEEYSCFADPHKYLTDRYGDYMKLPPENERVGTHEYKAYLKGEHDVKFA